MRVKAFSLIELLVVIGIVAIINIAMFPNFASIQNTAKEISSKSLARTIMIALEQYYFTNQGYPDGVNVSIYSIIEILVDNNFLQSVPINPFTGEPHSNFDSSGQILYKKLSSSNYLLIGYGNDNEDIIFEYP